MLFYLPAHEGVVRSLIPSSKPQHMQEAYIVAGYRTAVAKSKKGGFRFYRPDDLAVTVIRELLSSLPQLDPKLIDDVIVGNAVPEAEQGLQVGRIIAARAVGLHAAGMTVNRYCASGLETIAIATAKIRSGQAECIIAGNREHEYGANRRMENSPRLFDSERRSRLLPEYGVDSRSGGARI